MKKKGTVLTVILVFVLIVGLSLLLYPVVANYYNEKHQTKAVASYVSNLTQLEETDFADLWRAATDFNKTLFPGNNKYVLTEEQQAVYNTLLNVDGSDIMGYLEIPKIEVTLPVYHGTGDSVLRVGVGHLEWSSLPVGGADTHCVLSGHRGLPSAKLFTDLDKLEVGDVFALYVLDSVLTYEVDQILIVEPKDVDVLDIVAGGDYCSLVTCTPYGINTHRIIVRGKRVDTKYMPVQTRITSEAVQIEPLLIAPIAAVPLLLILFIVFFIYDRRGTGGDRD